MPTKTASRMSGSGDERSQGNRTLQPLPYLQPEHEAVQRLGVEPDTAKGFGAGYAPKGVMRGRLAIPIRTRQGELVAYCGRSVDGSTPTLSFPKDFQPDCYAFNAENVGEGECQVCRDPLDVLLAYQNGLENVVALLTDDITPDQLRMLADLSEDAGCENIEFT